jgi:hypothetical protein
MAAILKAVLTETVKVVNFIKYRETSSILFPILWNETGREHDELLLHTKVTWLSRGNVSSRQFELRSEVPMFLSDTTSDLSNRFADETRLSRQANLAHTFCCLSELNNSLQSFRTAPF